jgi:hypothetical protein
MRQETHNYSIVLVGSFNCLIFQPIWFKEQELISVTECDSAEIKLISKKATEFSTDWFNFRVFEDRADIHLLNETKFQEFIDLVIGTFTILNSTPLYKVGMNLSSVIPIDKEENWHAIGDDLSPKRFWNSILNEPGLEELFIKERSRSDSYEGYRRMSVSPISEQNEDKTLKDFGILVNINDHYEFAKPSESSIGADEIIKIIREESNNSKRKSDEIIEKFKSNYEQFL